jgi:hypothetical protein
VLHGVRHSTRAALPEAVAHTAFGPRLEAAAATLSVPNRVSRDDAVELIEELFSARISSGTADAILSGNALNAYLFLGSRGAGFIRPESPSTGWLS